MLTSKVPDVGVIEGCLNPKAPHSQLSYRALSHGIGIGMSPFPQDFCNLPAEMIRYLFNNS